MQRIAIVGTTGSGKTTLAKRLAGVLDVGHVELDALHWGPGWAAADRSTFRERVHAAVAGDRWTVDGNYSAVRDIVWSRADTVIWLDYSVGTVLWRLLVRTGRRGLLRETLWNGNRERLWVHVATRESLILWMFRTHWRQRALYASMAAAPEHGHVRLHRMGSPRHTERWLQGVAVPRAAASATRDRPR